MDNELKVKFYELVLNRYRDLINNKESLSISLIRQRVSPYNDFVKKVGEQIIVDLNPYDYSKNFFQAVELSITYIGKVKLISYQLNFWITFEEILNLGAANEMDRSIFLASLLRFFGSQDVLVCITKSGKAFIKLRVNEATHFISGENLSILSQEDGWKVFAADPLSYAFSDLAYENYEDE